MHPQPNVPSIASGWSVPLTLSPRRALPAPHFTHEQFVHAVRAHVATRPGCAAVKTAKLTYGVGPGYARGVTYYGAWRNGEPQAVCFVEVCATGEEGATHECAHILAGNIAGHGADWKAACATLGLTTAEASGQVYASGHFALDVQAFLATLPAPNDGAPAFGSASAPGIGLPPTTGARGRCRAGWGVRGGKSRGAGSGSRLLKVACACGYTARVTGKWLAKGAPLCPTCEGHPPLKQSANQVLAAILVKGV